MSEQPLRQRVVTVPVEIIVRDAHSRIAIRTSFRVRGECRDIQAPCRSAPGRTGGYHARTLDFACRSAHIQPHWYGTLTGHGLRASA